MIKPSSLPVTLNGSEHARKVGSAPQPSASSRESLLRKSFAVATLAAMVGIAAAPIGCGHSEVDSSTNVHGGAGGSAGSTETSNGGTTVGGAGTGGVGGSEKYFVVTPQPLATTTVLVGQDDVHCLDATISNMTPQDLAVRNWGVRLEIVNSISTPIEGGLIDKSDPAKPSANFIMVSLWGIVNDVQLNHLLGPSELNQLGSDTDQTVIMEGIGSVDSGTTQAAVVFDLDNNPALAGTQIQCTLKDLTAPGKGYVVTDTNNPDTTPLDPKHISPSGDIVGEVITIQ